MLLPKPVGITNLVDSNLLLRGAQNNILCLPLLTGLLQNCVSETN